MHFAPRVCVHHSASAGLFALSVLFAFASACREPLSPRPREPLVLDRVAGSDASPRARWLYHPRRSAALNARVALDAKRVLYVGARGERWLDDVQQKQLSSAAELAQRDLIAAHAAKNGMWEFLDESGKVLIAETPLGAFAEERDPPEPLAKVSAAPPHLAGLTRAGRLLVSQDMGSSWLAVEPFKARFADVAMSTNGPALALAVPERLYDSADRGASWAPVSSQPVGALALFTTPGPIVVRSALGDYDFDPVKKTLNERATPFVAKELVLSREPPRGPDAGALTSGRAAIIDGTYLELEPDPDLRDGWRLWRGAFDSELSMVQLDALRGCRATRISGFGTYVHVACSLERPTAASHKIRLYQSNDGARSLRPAGRELFGVMGSMHLATGARGQLLLSGICPPHLGSAGCLPEGVYRMPFSRASATPRRPSLSLAATPSLSRLADALSFSVDGTIAYAVGPRSKDNTLALYVSDDGGQRFEARPLVKLPPGSVSERARSAQEPVAALSLATAGDGSVSVVFSIRGTKRLLLADRSGRLVTASAPPSSTATLVGAAGAHALAISPKSGQTYETLDGGVSWNRSGKLPATICPDDADCDVPVYCHDSGCVVADEMSRVGWFAQPQRNPPKARDEHEVTAARRHLRSRLGCVLEPDPWETLAGVRSLPTGDQSAMGSTAWVASGYDTEQATAWVYHGEPGPAQQVVRQELLGEVANPERYAFMVVGQIEGSAALRYRLPETSRPELSDVRVAWDNRFEGRIGHGRLPHPVEFTGTDYQTESSGAKHAVVDLLSIASGGLYLRLYKNRAKQPTYFFDYSKVSEVPSFGMPRLEFKVERREWLRIDGRHLPIFVKERGGVVVRASRAAGGWHFDAFTAGLPRPEDLGLIQFATLTYLKDEPALFIMRDDRGTGQFGGYILPFLSQGNVFGPERQAPTQLSFSGDPKPCSETQRRTTPRLIVPYQPGTRHPIVVSDAVEPIRVLLTSDAVMHGTVDEPCVAAFGAEILREELGGTGEFVTAILPLANLEQSWLFRETRDNDQPHAEIQFRKMACRFDPQVEFPDSIYGAPGTSVRRAL